MTEASNQLHLEILAAKTLRENFADIINADGSGETWSLIVEGETNLEEAIDLAAKQLVYDFAAVKGLTIMQEDLKRRQERIAARIDNLRTAIHVAMEQAGKKKIEHPAVTISVRAKPPAVIVTDEAAIPSQYWKQGEPRLDKTAVSKALKAKEAVPGTCLSNGGTTLALTWS